MRKINLRSAILSFTVLMSLFSAPSIHAQSFDSVTHIHSIKVIGKKILIGTHEGLFVYKGPNNMKPIGKKRFDIMGLAISGRTMYASGHPGKGSKLPEPVGLLRSDDGGITWKEVSLQGEVDFHFLEGRGREIYGVDAQTNMLLYSSNSGKVWRKVEPNQFSDIAISSQKLGDSFVIQDKKLMKSSGTFTDLSLIRTAFSISEIELVGRTLYASSGKSILKSLNQGKAWKKIYTFDIEVTALSSSNDLLVAVVGNQILASDDGGKNFK
ncbi:MAG: hypothetical protein O2903_06605 [Actinobacteria bacterium]|nr:hypothetical protein [Actinomycetota bacterium]MDA2982361.1 hypothetical protein [Actinomycetota bacterium]